MCGGFQSLLCALLVSGMAVGESLVPPPRSDVTQQGRAVPGSVLEMSSRNVRPSVQILSRKFHHRVVCNGASQRISVLATRMVFGARPATEYWLIVRRVSEFPE